MDREKLALDTHEKGANCAQSVLVVLCDEIGLDRDEALKLTACFGRGMGSGEVCGTLSGALMALGMKYGSVKEGDLKSKKAMSKKAYEFTEKFKKKYHTVLCRELLADSQKENGDASAICPKLITSAVNWAEEMLHK
ncbi:MAG TPA: hypothetical protein DEP42_04635 [Ruminococcaceae bacterium]|nr:hypothetical protein [Oscillospiraceae bacterium]